MTHQQDYEAIQSGFVAALGGAASESEALILHAVARYETGFGRWWKSAAGKTSFNLGAIQYKTPKSLGLTPPYPEMSPDQLGFLYTDTTPQSDGTSKPYAVYFRRYTSLADGARALARTVYLVNGRSKVLAAASRGDVYGVSAAMHATRYYEGWGATVEKRIANHHKAMLGALTAICSALGKPLPSIGATPSTEPGGYITSHPTLRRGSGGPLHERSHVKALQHALNAYYDPDPLVADGKFGPLTETVVKGFQAAHGLTVDGIVGPKTWGALEG